MTTRRRNQRTENSELIQKLVYLVSPLISGIRTNKTIRIFKELNINDGPFTKEEDNKVLNHKVLKRYNIDEEILGLSSSRL